MSSTVQADWLSPARTRHCRPTFPINTSVLLRLLGISGLPLQVLTLVCALPCANSVQLFAEKYGKDYALASKAISLSLLLCVITIPLVMLVTGI